MPEIYMGHPSYSYDRDFRGYGEKGLEGLKWPNGAKIAVSFVINYEEVGPLYEETCLWERLLKMEMVLGR